VIEDIQYHKISYVVEADIYNGLEKQDKRIANLNGVR